MAVPNAIFSVSEKLIPVNASQILVYAWNVHGYQNTSVSTPLVDYIVALRAEAPWGLQALSPRTNALTLNWMRARLNDCQGQFRTWNV